MMSARLAEDPVFGDVALALQARECGAWLGCVESQRWVRLEFASHALAPADRIALADLLERNSDHVLHESSRETLGCRRLALTEMAPRTPGVAALLAVHDNAARAPDAVQLMGVVNVTPDSFSDHGRHLDPERAIAHGLELASEGASILDVGGDSSRPGATSIDADTELARVIPVVSGLAARTHLPISIDTTKAVVAEAALDSGASIVNDISAGTLDERMLDTVAAHRAGFVAMHMRGTPSDMQLDPAYDDVSREVTEFLRTRARACLAAGIERSRIWLDPGIGFGKSLAHNLALLARLNELRSLGLPVCLGVSRKSFIAAVEKRAGSPQTGSDPDDRIGGTAAALTVGVWNGASILRVHDVRVMAQAARVARALMLENREEARD